MTEILYVKYDRDGLPVCVADSEEELAELTGTKKRTVIQGLSHKCRAYARVEVEVED